MVNRIIITGDIFRPTCHSNGLIEGSQNWNINNRFLLFKHLFNSITGLPVEKCYWDPVKSFDATFFYQLLDYPLVSQSSWFSIYEEKNLPLAAENYLLKFFQNAFIVGFELPPILCDFFTRNNISYISFIDYPVRFLDDTIAGLSTNVSDVFTILKKYQIDEEGFYMHAALSKVRLGGVNIIEDDSAVFFGQTDVDLSLYKDGRCLKVLDFEKEIVAIAKSHKKLYFKLHPYAEAVSQSLACFMQEHNIEIINWNVYELLANEKLKTVVSISSSVLEEAKYFDKDIICLHAMPHRYASERIINNFDASLHVPIGCDILLPDFWLNIFTSIELSKEVSFNNCLPFESNTFRYSTSAFWGYDKLYKPLVHLIYYNNPIRSDIHSIKENCSFLSRNIDELRKLSDSVSQEMAQLHEVDDTTKLSLVELKEISNVLTINMNRVNQMNQRLSIDMDQLKQINQALNIDIDELKQINRALSTDLDRFKEINNVLSIDIDQLKKSNNDLTIDMDQLKCIKDVVILDINRLDEVSMILSSKFDEFKDHCKKIYKRKILPRLYRLLVEKVKVYF